MSQYLYAVYPGTVTLYDGTTKTWTAAQLATAYNVASEPYRVVNGSLDMPASDYFNYLHLKPRADDLYYDIKYIAEDDGLPEHLRPDFDGKKKYIQETDPLHIYPDEETEEKLHDDY